MKVKTIIKTGQLFMMAVLLAACASEDIAQDKKKENGTEVPKGGVVFATNDTKISAKRRFIDEDEFADAKTRTNIKHTPGNGADAYWTSDDFIWVKDKNGNWQQSTAITLHDGGTSAEFTLPGSKTDYADGCEVRYTGPNSYVGPSAEYDTISNTATCTTPNDFSKAGDWGDCGSGTARNTGNPNKFNFTLEHKSAYLCFLPRCENAALAPNVRLKSITITATNCYSPGLSGYIADCYDFDGENLSGSPYLLGTKSIVANISDFPLYTTANQTANATYMVVRPGTYDFKIEYTIKDPTTNVEAVVTQPLTNVTLNKGEINDITANLKVPEWDKYYLWDAPAHYWSGYESEQPFINQGQPGATQGPHYPQTLSGNRARWPHYANGFPYLLVPTATQSCKDCPNINELCWYIWKGDIHREAPKKHALSAYGHLREATTGGIWIKKKKAILRDNSDISEERFSSAFPDRNEVDRDWRTEATAQSAFPNAHNSPIGWQHTVVYTEGTPANTADYFFLPYLGTYRQGWLQDFGTPNYSLYWSSSADKQASSGSYNQAFYMEITINNIHVTSYYPDYRGLPAVAFE